MKTLLLAELSLVLAMGTITLSANSAWGADKKDTSKEAAVDAPTEDTDTLGGEQVNVDNIKQKYWARGDETEMGVVQNRTYSKSHKFEFGIMGATISTDPLLSVTALGAHFGYYFSEYFSLNLLGWKAWTGTTSSFNALNASIQSTNGINIIPDSNYQNGYLGGETSFSLLYGKLSLLGQAIIYYDLHFLAGAGVMLTQTGNDLAPSLGIGQSIYLTKNLAVRVDYRLMGYQENLLYKANPAVAGQINPNSRINFTNVVSIGFDILFGPGSKK